LLLIALQIHTVTYILLDSLPIVLLQKHADLHAFIDFDDADVPVAVQAEIIIIDLLWLVFVVLLLIDCLDQVCLLIVDLLKTVLT
jgi:hypothetical protein